MTRDEDKRAVRGEIDSVLVYGFTAGAGTEVDRYFLAATLAELEAEFRAAELAALETVLAQIDAHGHMQIPDDPPDCKRWAEAMALLRWHDPPDGT